jgi:hypothetical protein
MSKEIETKIQLISQVKLVPEDNMSTPVYCYTRLQDIVEEGIRSTFGMREKDAMILRLTRDLLAALELSSKSDELERKLKGAQLAAGRRQKAHDNLISTFEAVVKQRDELEKKLDALLDVR